ncbi:DNA-directed DNA polymerase alpha catalytic subunit pol1 [Scheffersomyces spartinae]|uniref:DNA polymerase n=1 Tax=Scheffersomyces spartinae TaxID=45513 RepID=A0A9P8AIS7_9ASCO|nr:DNA-directed DNA polymerase alpha catalytic subunit pol1 [Scheffersomyces spartinae]KAG7193441.1 DNA-directed DNA polymerase alpha catalytic subunit pol1 [Scheffersomyces spartinae]
MAKLREARLTGASVANFADEADMDDSRIYDEVDEESYRKHKRNQLMNDDFIVDDDGEGYVDNGVDEWDDSTRPQYYSDEENGVDNDTSKRSKARKHKPTKVKETAQISNFFSSMPSKTSRVEKSKPKMDVAIDDILDDFLVVKTKKSVAQATLFLLAPQGTKKHKLATTFSSSSKKPRKKYFSDDFDMEEGNGSSSIAEMIDTQPSSPVKVESSPLKAGKENISPDHEKSTIPLDDNNNFDDEDDVSSSEDEIVVTRKPRASGAVRKTLGVVSSVKLTPSAASIMSSPSQFSVVNNTEKVEEKLIHDEESDSFKMFWLDYAEVDHTLLLFGKVLTKGGKLISGMVQVNGMNKEIYLLPRETRLVDGEATDEPVTPLDVHNEIDGLFRDTWGLDRLLSKPETKSYAFELPQIPKETQYLKVFIPFRPPKQRNFVLPADIEGETFSHAFGTNANLFESFVIQRKIMGPCWLQISGGDFESIKNSSHCQVEVSIESPKHISPAQDPPPAPCLNVSSIAVQTVLNNSSNSQEVVAVSFATYNNVPLDAPIDEDLKPDEKITLARPVGSIAAPPGLQQLAEKQNVNLRLLPNERLLLNCLAALVKRADPDVFIGHRLENFALDVLVHRMYDLKVGSWSVFGRRLRKAWPDRFGRATGFNNSLQIREIFQGRLLCDIANEMGQSLTPKCQSWDLVEMYDIVCNRKHPSLEINYQEPKYAEDASFFMMALSENSTQVTMMASIAFNIQILSLSKQLTNIAGNAWSHTLGGTRAGRNEYILLHEFYNNNYIVPDREDKFHKNSSVQQAASMEATETDATTATSNKKPKYQGGLVFEPEKGLHKNFILVMDFNSLYPSIIQEFNICFTTIERTQFNITHDEDHDMPQLPERDLNMGVLPKLLNSLVSRRREVKKLLKAPSLTNFERAQFDIKQQALKLTANSMYGCLGYVNSRFYAKPLAMLVTNKGREILMDTRQLAESNGLRVVYGDTDSVMIDTGVQDYKEAFMIGEKFKVQVNERYRLLEIDIDNVFKRLLLHAKKKYAAMNASINKKTGEVEASLEVKGLDMRRREYCQLSKDISTFVLEKILSDLDPEQSLSEVYDYLEEMSLKIKNNEININKFRINTRLSKDPKNYPNGKSMPPVQVALRLREQGKVVKAGSVITYVITAPPSERNDDSNSMVQSPAERARAIQEVVKPNSGFKPDAAFYLEKQIFAPVERLIERIEGVDMMRIASALGIDTKRYVNRLRNSETVGGEIAPLESGISDAERFRQSSYFVINCPSCEKAFRFGGILASKDYKVTFNGIQCTECDHMFSVLEINSQLEVTLRQHISLYYAGWLVCDDSACGIQTRQISVYGKRCLGSSGKAHGCKGIMRYKYSDRALYNQLLYFDAIFDVDKAKLGQLRPIYDPFAANPPSKLPGGQIDALAEQNRIYFGYSKEVVQKYLGSCGRRYVNMGALFEFMS